MSEKRFFSLVEFGAWVRSQIQTLTDYMNLELSEVNTRMDDAFKDSIITGNAIIDVGSVDGVAVIYSGISTEHVIVLKVEVNAGTNDRYDIEIYDGAISSGGTLVYRAQQVQGNYLDSFAFYHQCQNTDLHARVVNLRQDGASFSANVKITLRLE